MGDTIEPRRAFRCVGMCVRACVWFFFFAVNNFALHTCCQAQSCKISHQRNTVTRPVCLIGPFWHSAYPDSSMEGAAERGTT